MVASAHSAARNQGNSLGYIGYEFGKEEKQCRGYRFQVGGQDEKGFYCQKISRRVCAIARPA